MKEEGRKVLREGTIESLEKERKREREMKREMKREIKTKRMHILYEERINTERKKDIAFNKEDLFFFYFFVKKKLRRCKLNSI